MEIVPVGNFENCYEVLLFILAIGVPISCLLFFKNVNGKMVGEALENCYVIIFKTDHDSCRHIIVVIFIEVCGSIGVGVMLARPILLLIVLFFYRHLKSHVLYGY